MSLIAIYKYRARQRYELEMQWLLKYDRRHCPWREPCKTLNSRTIQQISYIERIVKAIVEQHNKLHEMKKKWSDWSRRILRALTGTKLLLQIQKSEWNEKSNKWKENRRNSANVAGVTEEDGKTANTRSDENGMLYQKQHTNPIFQAGKQNRARDEQRRPIKVRFAKCSTIKQWEKRASTKNRIRARKSEIPNSS